MSTKDPPTTADIELEAKREKSRNRPSKLRAKAAREAKKAMNQALHSLKNEPQVAVEFLLDRKRKRKDAMVAREVETLPNIRAIQTLQVKMILDQSHRTV